MLLLGEPTNRTNRTDRIPKKGRVGKADKPSRRCEWCGASFTARDRQGRRFCGRRCAQHAKRTDAITARSLNHNGYYIGKVWRDGRRVTVLEHRWVMEQHLGRRLTRQESVHHINGVRTDNRVENLRLYGSISEHIRAEHIEDIKAAQARRRGTAHAESRINGLTYDF